MQSLNVEALRTVTAQPVQPVVKTAPVRPDPPQRRPPEPSSAVVLEGRFAERSAEERREPSTRRVEAPAPAQPLLAAQRRLTQFIALTSADSDPMVRAAVSQMQAQFSAVGPSAASNFPTVEEVARMREQVESAASSEGPSDIQRVRIMSVLAELMRRAEAVAVAQQVAAAEAAAQRAEAVAAAVRSEPSASARTHTRITRVSPAAAAISQSAPSR